MIAALVVAMVSIAIADAHFSVEVTTGDYVDGWSTSSVDGTVTASNEDTIAVYYDIVAVGDDPDLATDSSAEETGTIEVPFTVTDGMWWVYGWAVSDIETVAADPVAVWVDTLAPLVDIDAVETTDTVEVAISVVDDDSLTDDVSGFASMYYGVFPADSDLPTDTAAWESTTTADVALSLEAEGHWIVAVLAFDVAGNQFLDEEHVVIEGPAMSGISGMVSGYESAESTVVVPIAGASVKVWSGLDATLTVEASATTAADGSYAVDVEPGDYVVQFEAAGYAVQFFDMAADLSDAATVTVEPALFTADIDALLSVVSDVDFVELWGEDRYATAIAISLAAYPDGLSDDTTKTVVLARGERFPDALAGSALASLVDGPILLTRSARLLDEVAAEIERLGAERVILLGEELALSADVEDAVLELEDVTDVMRFGGESRYDTANEIAEYLISELGEDFGGAAFVGTGARFPDSLAASPIIGAQGMPLFLAHPTAGLNAAAMSIIETSGVEAAYILGGPLAVSEDVESDLEELLGEDGVVERVAGEDRYETAAEVAAFGVGLGHTWDMVGIASGVRFPDSLTGGAYQAKSGSVILLTRLSSLNEYTKSALEDNIAEINEVRIFGGPLAIAQEVRDEIKAIFGVE